MRSGAHIQSLATAFAAPHDWQAILFGILSRLARHLRLPIEPWHGFAQADARPTSACCLCSHRSIPGPG